MEKRAIRNIDKVPEWIREAIADESGTDDVYIHKSRESSLSIPDPNSSTEELRPIKAFLLIDSGTEQKSDNRVQVLWDIKADEGKIYDKKFATPQEAEMKFAEITKQLQSINKLSETTPDKAKELAKDLVSELGRTSDPITTEISPQHSMSNLQIREGWNIIEKQGKLLVDFSSDFLKKAFINFKSPEGEPIQPAEKVYSTATRLHCGSDNFILSYWRKVKTSDGNIIRNALLVERINSNDKFFINNVSSDQYDTLCSNLTPDSVAYGINYDSITGIWYKKAGQVSVERFFGDPTDVADAINKVDKARKEGKEPPELTKAIDLPKLEKKPKGKKEEGEKDLKDIEEFMKEPLGGETLPESPLTENAPKSEKMPDVGFPGLQKEAKEEDPSNFEVGSKIVCIHRDAGEYTSGTVTKVSPDQITFKVVDWGRLPGSNSDLEFYKEQIGSELTSKISGESEREFITPEHLDTILHPSTEKATVVPEVPITEDEVPEPISAEETETKPVEEEASEEEEKEEDEEEESEEGSPDMGSPEDEEVLYKEASIDLWKIHWSSLLKHSDGLLSWIKALYEGLPKGISAYPTGGGPGGLIPAWPGAGSASPGEKLPPPGHIPGTVPKGTGEPAGKPIAPEMGLGGFEPGKILHVKDPRTGRVTEKIGPGHKFLRNGQSPSHEAGFGKDQLALELRHLDGLYKATLREIDKAKILQEELPELRATLKFLEDNKKVRIVPAGGNKYKLEKYTEEEEKASGDPSKTLNELKELKKHHYLERAYSITQTFIGECGITTTDEKTGRERAKNLHELTPIEANFIIEKLKAKGEAPLKGEKAEEIAENLADDYVRKATQTSSSSETNFLSELRRLFKEIKQTEIALRSSINGLKSALIDPASWSADKLPSVIKDEDYGQAQLAIILKFLRQSSVNPAMVVPPNREELWRKVEKHIPAVEEEIAAQDLVWANKYNTYLEMHEKLVEEEQGFSKIVRSLEGRAGEDQMSLLDIIDRMIATEQQLVSLKTSNEINPELGHALEAKIDELNSEREALLSKPDVDETIKKKQESLEKIRQQVKSYQEKQVKPDEDKLFALEKKLTDLMAEAGAIWRP